jgi:hypothetical protein
LLTRVRHELPPVGAKIRRERSVTAKRRGDALKHFDARPLQALIRQPDDRENALAIGRSIDLTAHSFLAADKLPAKDRDRSTCLLRCFDPSLIRHAHL